LNVPNITFVGRAMYKGESDSWAAKGARMTFKQWRHVSDGARLPSSAWDILQDWGAEREKLIGALEKCVFVMDGENITQQTYIREARAVLTEVRRTG